MFYLIYDLILILASPLIILFHIYRSVGRGRPVALRSRMGRLSREEREKIAGRDVVWVHAVSVGETIAVKSLIRALRKRFPEKAIVLSNVTETGRSVAAGIPEVDLCIYFPFDFSFSVNRLLADLKPCVLVVAETEIWPNLLKGTATKGIPAVLVNGRISDRSFGRYLALRRVFSKVLRNFSALCMQTAEDAERIREIGADPGKVVVAGNLKYDVPSSAVDPEKLASLRREFMIPSGLAVLTAGSTHQGEEEIVVETLSALAPDRDVMLVLAPRHPERIPEVAGILQSRGIRFVVRSALGANSAMLSKGEVLLVDTVGELMKFYSLSDIVFVGGSLLPVGGHNILEPASLQIPVLFGPHMSNFREIAALILRHRSGIQVGDGRALTAAVSELLHDKEQCLLIGRNSAALFDENRGATDRMTEVIASCLETPRKKTG
jgi:3-deoxy-D-manno-octulosonic-acid transferase